jgi:hypothetical protein
MNQATQTPSPLPGAATTPAVAKTSGTPAASPQVTPASSPSAAGSAARGHAAIPLPSLKATETITWVKFDRPRFAIGEIIISSFTIVGIILLVAVGAGMILGQFRSKARGGTHGTGGLDLR